MKVYKWGGTLPHLDTLQAQESSLQSEGIQVLCRREEEYIVKDILSLCHVPIQIRLLANNVSPTY